MSYPAYPNQAPQQGQQSGYPPQQPQQGQQSGYPPQQPQQGQQSGYPPQQPQQGQQSGYPPQQPQQGQQSGYPPQQPQYNNNQPPAGYPNPNQVGFNQGGQPQQPYPAQPPQYNLGTGPQQGYPSQPSYPQAGAPPPQQQGYGQQQYAPQQPHGGYPAYNPGQGQGYPPQQQNMQQPQYGAPPVQNYHQHPQQGQQGQGYAPPGQGHPQQHAPQQGATQGSVRPTAGFNAQADAQALRKAMKGMGCNENEVINILARRTTNERQQIKLAFKAMHGKDLAKELESELRGKLEDVALSLMDTAAEFDCKELKHAMAGIGTNESTLIEILSTRSNAEIHAIRDTYRKMYKKDLEKELKSEASFHFERFLISLSCGGRDETGQTDVNRARNDAQELLKAGVKKIGTDEGMFNAILVGQNHNQLRLVFEEYQKMAGHDIEQAVKQEFSGDVEAGLITVIKCARNQPAYFAERLYMSMKGMGTQDRNLIRVCISRCEKDMVQIRQEFQRLYGKTLESFISGDASGKYKQVLLTLVQGN